MSQEQDDFKVTWRERWVEDWDNPDRNNRDLFVGVYSRWRPGSDHDDLEVMRDGAVHFSTDTPRIDLGKELAERLAATARAFAKEYGF